MNKGQSVIELLIAMVIFAITASAVAFLIIDGYVADRAGQERSIATFLAQEGLERARLTRNANWANLVSLAPQSIGKFTRTVSVENIDSIRKKATSKVTWQLTGTRPQEVALVTYLTNWQIPAVPDCNSACINAGFRRGSCTTTKACRGAILGGLGGYQCLSNRVCCCR